MVDSFVYFVYKTTMYIVKCYSKNKMGHATTGTNTILTILLLRKGDNCY